MTSTVPQVQLSRQPADGRSLVTAIITAYRRPYSIRPLSEALRAQSVPVMSIWGWANEPTKLVSQMLRKASLDRLVTSHENAYFHGRFSLALMAPTPYVAIFDDDTIPGPHWIANCLETLAALEASGIQAILGTAGVELHSPGYYERTMHGWQRPADVPLEVDLVGQGWFMRSEHVHYLFAAPPVTGTNGEDIELAARAWRLAGIRSYCPPHPADDKSRWGSTRGMELGLDREASSRKADHTAERDHIVRAEIAAGWQPLFARGAVVAGTLSIGTLGVPSASAAPSETPEASSTSSTPSSLPEVPPESATAERNIPLHEPDPNVAFRSAKGRSSTPAQTPQQEPNLAISHLDIAASLGDLSAAREALAGCACRRVELGHGLMCTPQPRELLNIVREHLAPCGTVTCRVPNARHHDRVGSLLRGNWADGVLVNGHWFNDPTGKSSGVEVNDGAPQLRHFTRREVEKVFYRAGFEAPCMEVVSNSLLDVWRHRGCPATVELGPLRMALASANDAEEFYAAEYSVTGRPAQRPEHGLTSIVIVTFNQVDFTQQCLQSLLSVTDEPIELILVDNGSTDGTPDYLRAMAARLGEGGTRMTVIANSDNRGFPAAANQGIQASRGDQVLLLNNDVLLTTGWLDRMLRALHSDSAIGLVGPCSNCVSGPQEITPGYTDLASLDGFAWEWGKAHAAVREDVGRLVGFCLLIKRAVIDQVGLLDEQFGIGNFEDDDLCKRAVLAGWRCVIARDSYIHHFGHRSFHGAGVDLNALLVENQAKFQDKWRGSVNRGPGTVDKGSVNRGAWTVNRAEMQAFANPPLARNCNLPHSPSNVTTVPRFITASPRPRVSASSSLPLSHSPTFPITSSVVTHHSPLRTPHSCCLLSLCMIVRNNARTIEACLISIRPWVDEIIVVDTGSTDGTPEICRRLGADVYFMKWPDSFAAARNESLKYARGQWIFWMDSDDVIDEDNGRKLRALVEGAHGQPPPHERDPSLMGYVMQVHCPGPGADGQFDVTVVDHCKLFRNHPELRFVHRIHEQILGSIRAVGGELAMTDVFVVHSGADHTADGRRRKLLRDLRLLRLDLREHPEHPFVLFNFGMTYADMHRYEKAVRYLRRSIECAGPRDSHVRKAYALLVSSLHHLGRIDEAWKTCTHAMGLFPQDLELLFRQGILAHELGDLKKAEASYLEILNGQLPRELASVDQGMTTFKARHNLAAVYAQMHAHLKAEEQWRLILTEVPGYADGWQGLGECLLRQGKLVEVTELAQHLLASPGVSTSLRALDPPKDTGARHASWSLPPVPASPNVKAVGVLLASRLAVASGRIGEAIHLLEQGALECPQQPSLWAELASLLFDRFPVAAQAALERLVELEPNDGSAWCNLGTVHSRQGRMDQAAIAFRRSVRLRPNSAQAHLTLGYALRHIGRHPQARAAWQRCIDLEPESRLADEARRRLAECEPMTLPLQPTIASLAPLRLPLTG